MNCPFCFTHMFQSGDYKCCSSCPGKLKIHYLTFSPKQDSSTFDHFHVYNEDGYYRMTYRTPYQNEPATLFVYKLAPLKAPQKIYSSHCQKPVNPQQAYDILHKILKLKAFL